MTPHLSETRGDTAGNPPVDTSDAIRDATGDDLSALAWVHDELRRSLDTAHKALRRFVRETEALDHADLDAVDPSVLRTARAQLHQGVGALELIGQSAAATVLRASEAAVQRFVSRPHRLNSLVVDDIERTSFALLDYLTRLLADKPVSALSLFPQYRAVQEAAGAERVHPADLWPIDWEWRELPSDPAAVPREPDAATLAAFESLLLQLMRLPNPLKTAVRMSDLTAGLGAGALQSHVATLWQLAAAVFEAQGHGLLGFDVFSKRVASRLLAQFRMLARGETEVSERLAQDLLFFCAQSASPGDGRHAPRLAAARLAYGLVRHVPTDYSISALGRFDPAAVAQARKRVTAAKEAWSAAAGGELHRLSGLSEQFALVGESLRKLFPLGDTFAGELQQAVAQTQHGGSAPPAPLAMEVATSLLYVDAVLEDADFDHPEQAERVGRLAHRLAAVRAGQPPEPLEGWMEDLYRRVSDRQTMGSVVQELRASLSEAETLIDQYFRKPEDRQVLIPVPSQLSSMRGVLSVLGMDHAAAALLRMRDEVDALASTEVDTERVGETGVFDRLAGNLGALGFLIDMLSVQPQMAKSLFTYDAESGALQPVMGRAETHAPPIAKPEATPAVEQRLIEQAQMLAFTSVREDVPTAEVMRDLEHLSQQAQAADQAGLAAAVLKAQEAFDLADGPDSEAAARGELSEALVDFVATSSEPAGLDEAPQPFVATTANRITLDFGNPATPAPADALALDDEMREVFLEEAREVVDEATRVRAELADAPDDLGHLTTLRRAFHTLKGSSRMVGLKDFGEAAWACEQLYNTQLAEQGAAPPALIDFTGWALGYLSGWVDDIHAGHIGAHDAATVIAAARQLREPGPATASLPVTPVLPTDLDEPTEPIEPSFEATPPFEDEFPQSDALAFGNPDAPPLIAFELNLADLDNDLVTDQRTDFETAGSAELPILDPTAVAETDRVSQDLSTPAPFDPFDEFPTEPLPLGEVVEATSNELVDLELDFMLEFEPDPLTESELASSRALVDASNVASDLEPGPAPGPDDAASGDDELVKVVGPLRIGIPLFNIYLNEADELSRRLATEVAEWAMELHRPIGEAPIALAHSLAGSSATVGFTDLSHLARSLEHAQTRSQAIGHGTLEEARLFVDAAEEIRRLLHQFAAGFLKEPSPDLLARLADHELSSGRRLEAAAAETDSAADSDADADVDLDVGVTAISQPEPEPDAEAEPAATGSVAGDSILHSGIDLAPYDAEADVDAEAAFDPRADLHPSSRSAPETVYPDLNDGAWALDSLPAELSAVMPIAEAAHFAVEAPAPDAASEVVAEPTAEAHADIEPDAKPERADLPAAPAGARFDPLGLVELKPFGDLALPVERTSPASHALVDADDAIDAVDAIDAELFPIFEEEAEELLPQLASRLRDWVRKPAEPAHPAGCMRTLHTLKGGARLAGAMRLGEMAHRLESRIERVLAQPPIQAADVETLQSDGDALLQTFEALRSGAPIEERRSEPRSAAPDDGAAAPAPVPELDVLLDAAPPETPVDALTDATEQAVASAATDEPAALDDAVGLDGAAPTDAAEPAAEPTAQAQATAQPEIDWSRFESDAAAPKRAAPERMQGTQSAVRVRAPVLDRLVNQAGEVSIARSRIESGVVQIKSSLGDLTENLERLRGQLRDIEFHGETQMSSRLEAAKAASQSFDPLEFDRFTRFQELTRMMAESVNDVATVQRTLQRSLEATEDELVAQARMTRDLQDDLLRTRMVEFEGLSDRLYRVVRQAAKETGKSVRLDIVGGSIEVDRGVLDRMTGAFEHLLRNCVTHGIESPSDRSAAAKEPTGNITVALSQEANEVSVEFRDDGAGLNLPRIRAKGIEQGLLDGQAEASDAELANLIFAPGFSTAEQVTELAGRGVGMDVVRSEVNAMGGRIETATAAGQGTSFKLILPLTTAVTQVVMLRCGDTRVAVPSTLVEVVRRATPAETDAAYASGSYEIGDKALQFFWLGSLLQISAKPAESTARTRSIVVIRSAQQRIALHVDEVLGNQEVVVKNLGPQLSRLPGLAGVTLLASGDVALIYNPVALAALYGDAARAATHAALHSATTAGTGLLDAMPGGLATADAEAPLVMVVDDSLTVRRVTQRLLLREGYRVVLAKDGLDALERLAEAVPQIVLSDIEMPRMDGFDLVRNMRADARLRDLPIIMITSRIAQKHREYAAELGVDHYLGKPYSEEDLLALIGRYTRQQQIAA